ERLKADITIRVNQIVTFFLIESSYHILDQNRYQVDTSLIHLESRKSPIAGCLMLTLEGFPFITATTLRLKRDLITLSIVPRLWSTGPSSAFNILISFVLTLDFTCLLSTKLSTLEALKGLILKIPGAITLSLFITFNSREEGAEFEVTGFDKAFVLSTLGRTKDFGKGVTE
ncbi:hypothetical protein Tco_0298525, partial [Tanacetum coccineum]